MMRAGRRAGQGLVRAQEARRRAAPAEDTEGVERRAGIGGCCDRGEQRLGSGLLPEALSSIRVESPQRESGLPSGGLRFARKAGISSVRIACARSAAHVGGEAVVAMLPVTLETVATHVRPAAAESSNAESLTGGCWWTFCAFALHADLARAWLAGWLEEQFPDAREQRWATLVAFSEVVTNAVLHGAGPITVHAWLTQRAVVCEVTDRCARLPLSIETGLEDERCRGLSLVDALTERWWVRAAPRGGKTTCLLVVLRPDREPSIGRLGRDLPQAASRVPGASG